MCVSIYFVYKVHKILRWLQAFINYCIFVHFFHQISGDFPNVQDALYKATSRLRDNFFAITQNTGGAGIYRRLSDSIPSSLGGTPVVGANRDLNVHSLSQSIDHLTLSRNLDRSSAPGIWTPKVCLFLSIACFTFQVFPFYMIKFDDRRWVG